MPAAEMSLKPEAIREALERVLASADFHASARNRKVLRYVVEETLAGRADRIKAYSIATRVFGRDLHFDPQLELDCSHRGRAAPPVAGTLLLTSDQCDPVRIAVPKGAYVPTCEAKAGGAPGLDARRSVARPGAARCCFR